MLPRSARTHACRVHTRVNAWDSVATGVRKSANTARKSACATSGSRGINNSPRSARNSTNNVNPGADLQGFPMTIRGYGSNIVLKGRRKASPVAKRQPQRFCGIPQFADLLRDGLIARNHFHSPAKHRGSVEDAANQPRASRLSRINSSTSDVPSGTRLRTYSRARRRACAHEEMWTSPSSIRSTTWSP